MQVLLVLDGSPERFAEHDDQRGRALELGRGDARDLLAVGAGAAPSATASSPAALLQPLEGLRADHAEPPRVREVVVGRPARQLEQLLERLAVDRPRVEGLDRAPRADRLLGVHAREVRACPGGRVGGQSYPCGRARGYRQRSDA